MPVDREAALEQQLAGQVLNQRLAALKTHDPNFDPEEFLERAQGVVQAMAAASRKGNLDALSADIFEGRFPEWKAGFMATPWAAELAGENLTIHGMTIADVGMGLALGSIINEASPDKATYDAITVRIDAESDGADPFTEFWIFIRRVGDGAAGTAPQTGECLNCGAPLSLNAMGACVYCGASLTVHADSTWTLAEITNIQLPLA